MTNIYSSDGLVTAALLVICTCAYLKRIPRLNAWLFADKHGALYKASVIGTRCSFVVSPLCVLMAVYLLLIK